MVRNVRRMGMLLPRLQNAELLLQLCLLWLWQNMTCLASAVAIESLDRDAHVDESDHNVTDDRLSSTRQFAVVACRLTQLDYDCQRAGV